MNDETTLLDKFSAIQGDLNSHLLERGTAVEVAMLALLSGEHCLFLGPPGTAKSLLVRKICERIGGVNMFEHLLTRFSTPEELFGPLSLACLEHDEYRRITTATLVDAHVAFIDEIWKANSSILNSLLGIVNERLYFEGGHGQPVPLLSLFAASNEAPESEGLDALFDRFMLRMEIQYLAGDESFRALFRLSDAPPTCVLSLDELRAAQSEVLGVEFSESACNAMLDIKNLLEEEGVSVSDRRWKTCAKLVRAKAWLDGDAVAVAEHCEVLVHALWTESKERRLVERIVAKVAAPLNLEALELQDAAQDLYDQRPKPDHPRIAEALEPLLRQLSDIRTRLEQRMSSVPERRTGRARQALGKIETWHRALSQLALRSLSTLHQAPGSA